MVLLCAVDDKLASTFIALGHTTAIIVVKKGRLDWKASNTCSCMLWSTHCSVFLCLVYLAGESSHHYSNAIDGTNISAPL